MRAAGRNEMRQMDQYTIETLGLPGVVLMENAGAKVADELLRLAGKQQDAKFVVVAGSGNNGGDGFVIARRLLDEGRDCTLCLAANPLRIQGDAKIHFDVYIKRGLPIIYVNEKTMPEVQQLLVKADFIADALLGTGATGELREPIRSLVKLVNESKTHITSVDIPSGLDSDTGEVVDIAVRANRTITFVAPKKGFFLQQGPKYIGSWEAVNISLPPAVLDRFSEKLPFVITQSLAASCVPKRTKDGHKGTFGHVLVIGGSKSYVGAPIFTAKAACHSGAGLVTLGVPEGIYPMAAAQLPEALFWPMKDTDGHHAMQSWHKMQFRPFDVVAVGPGLSRFEGGELLMEELWNSLDRQPVVVDADALFLSRHLLETIRNYPGHVLFTPHPGEMAALLNTTVREVEANRLEIAKQFATKHQLYLLLKGHRSIIATPEGMLYVNPIGSDALGKGGSGDVLTGLIASFLAQGATPVDALIAATFLHAEAGEQQAEIHSNYGVIAPAIIEGSKILLRKWMEE